MQVFPYDVVKSTSRNSCKRSSSDIYDNYICFSVFKFVLWLLGQKYAFPLSSNHNDGSHLTITDHVTSYVTGFTQFVV